MKKGKLLVALLSLFAFAGIGLSTLTGCGGKPSDPGKQEGEKFAITWTIPEHATVKMDDGSEPVKEAENGTSIIFTVATDEGYSIDSVKANNKRVSAKSGKYAISISKATEIVIAVKEAIGELKVTPPTKLTYYAGDELDLTGMVVEVSYSTGRKETIEYGADGYSVYPTVFEGGEDHFEVIYSGTTVNVPLDKRVEYLVSIDPNGGSIASSWIEKVQAMNLNNFAVSDAGVVSFTYYQNITKTINLPTKEEMHRENHSFTQWSYDGTINSNSTGSIIAVAGWQIELVEVDVVTLFLEDDVPYLNVHGTFKASEEVYLRLYEGNADIGFDGPTFKGTSGSEFNAKFDLRELSAKGSEYEGKWMDIRFNAIYDGKETSMEIFVNNVTVEMSTKIYKDEFVYSFQVYDGKLKVLFETVTGVSYDILPHAVDGKDYLQIKGSGLTEYANNYFAISWWANGETDFVGAPISSNGEVTLEFPLEVLGAKTGTNCYAHETIFADSSMTEVLYGGTNTNLLIKEIRNSFPKLAVRKGDVTYGISYVGLDNITYYIGYTWDGLIVYPADESVVIENASIELRNNKVYYIVTGSTSLTPDKFVYGFYFQHVNNLDGLGEACVYNDYQDDATPTIDQQAVIENGRFEMSVCATDVLAEQFKASNDIKWGLLSKYYFAPDTNPIELKPTTISEDPIELDGIRYSVFMDNNSTWNIASLVLEKI